MEITTFLQRISDPLYVFLFGKEQFPTYVTDTENNAEYLCLSADMFTNAVEHDDLNTMKFLKQKQCPCDYSAFRAAVKNGNLKILQWMRDHNCPWDAYTFIVAAKNGNLKVLQWLKENGCPWNEWTFIAAAENGNVANARWLKDAGCPCTLGTYTMAEKKNNLEMMDFFNKKRYFSNKFKFRIKFIYF